MSIKGKIEAIIYAADEPVTLNQLSALLKADVLGELLTQEVSQEQPGGPERPDAPSFFDGQSLNPKDLGEEQQYQREKDDGKRVKAHISKILEELTTEYATTDHGIEVRQLAGGYRMATKPENHDVVIGFAKSLKPPIRLSLPALETLAVIAYKQPVTGPEISEIRGVDTSGVIATLLDRKLVTTAGRKQVIGRPILYKTTKEFLLRFGLNSVAELPSMEEFEKLGDAQAGLFGEANIVASDEGSKPSAESAPGTEESGSVVAEKETEDESSTSTEDHL